MNITFIGTGYVGLVSGIMMSHVGHQVTCIDNDQSKITELKKNILPIYEPGLEDYLLSSLEAGRIKFTDKYDEEIKNAHAVFITVGTPSQPSGEADLRYVFESLENLSKLINPQCLIVIKSTVPPTSCKKIQEYLKQKGFHFFVASNPEFLREGSAVHDFLKPDRIIIGTDNEYSEKILREIYLPLTDKNIPLLNTDPTTAELIKYSSNAFLATKIAFTNEMANLCEKTGADITNLTLGMGSDTRIGKNFLNAGPGFGGSCFPKDILALSYLSKNYKTECKVLEAVISSNKQRPYDMADKIEYLAKNNNIRPLSKPAYGREFEGDTEPRSAAYIEVREDSSTESTYKLPAEIEFQKRSITVLGLTYKAGTDDIRSSPAIKIIKILLDRGISIKASDPIGINNAKKYFQHPNLSYVNSIPEACIDSDAIIIATEWPEFQELNWDEIYKYVKAPIIIDLRNLLDKTSIKEKGFKYYPIGYKLDVT